MAGPGAPVAPPPGFGGEPQPAAVAGPIEASPDPVASGVTDTAAASPLAATPTEATPEEVPAREAPPAETPTAAAPTDAPAVMASEIPAPGEQDAAPRVAADPALKEIADAPPPAASPADDAAADDAPAEAQAPARRSRRSGSDDPEPATAT